MWCWDLIPWRSTWAIIPISGPWWAGYATVSGKARFELDGKIFQISANEGNNQLHGGIRGFDKQIWTPHIQKTPDR